MNPITEKPAETVSETLTETLQTKLSNPASTPEFDLHGSVNEVLKNVGLTAADTGGKLTMYADRDNPFWEIPLFRKTSIRTWLLISSPLKLRWARIEA